MVAGRPGRPGIGGGPLAPPDRGQCPVAQYPRRTLERGQGGRQGHPSMLRLRLRGKLEASIGVRPTNRARRGGRRAVRTRARHLVRRWRPDTARAAESFEHHAAYGPADEHMFLMRQVDAPNEQRTLEAGELERNQ